MQRSQWGAGRQVGGSIKDAGLKGRKRTRPCSLIQIPSYICLCYCPQALSGAGTVSQWVETITMAPEAAFLGQSSGSRTGMCRRNPWEWGTSWACQLHSGSFSFKRSGLGPKNESSNKLQREATSADLGLRVEEQLIRGASIRILAIFI